MSVEDRSVSDAGYETDDGKLYTPWLDLSVGFEYTVENTPEKVRGMLVIDPDGARDMLDFRDINTTALQSQGTIDLAGAVIDASGFDSADFDVAEPGDSKTVTVPFGVIVEVQDSRSNVLVESETTSSVDISVTHTGSTVVVSMTVEGDVAFQGNESDSEPA